MANKWTRLLTCLATGLAVLVLLVYLFNYHETAETAFIRQTTNPSILLSHNSSASSPLTHQYRPYATPITTFTTDIVQSTYPPTVLPTEVTNATFFNSFKDDYIYDKFTIVMPTFKRTENLFLVMDQYCGFHDIIDRIIILWNNIGIPIPEKVESRVDQCNVPTMIRIMEKNNLTSRFFPYRQIKTAGVMSLDDDNLIDRPTLELAFKTFQKYPYKLVGYDARGFKTSNSQHYNYSFKTNPYSVILTNRAFIHHKYLKMFTDIPKVLTDFVIEHKNGEDLIMNVVVGKYLKENNRGQCVGVHVNSNIKALNNFSKEHYGGLSRRPSHIQDRHKCLQLLGDTYGDLHLYLPQSTLVISKPTDI